MKAVIDLIVPGKKVFEIPSRCRCGSEIKWWNHAKKPVETCLNCAMPTYVRVRYLQHDSISAAGVQRASGGRGRTAATVTTNEPFDWLCREGIRKPRWSSESCKRLRSVQPKGSQNPNRFRSEWSVQPKGRVRKLAERRDIVTDAPTATEAEEVDLDDSDEQTLVDLDEEVSTSAM